jgi:hypothetical protein
LTYFVVEDLSLSLSLSASVALDEPLLDGVEDDEDDGVLLAPAPAALPLVPELDGEELDDDAPPLAGLLVESLELDELEPEGAALGELLEPDEDALPEGDVLGEVVAPPLADEDEEPDGEVVAPEGAVDEELEDLSAPRSHAVISEAPSARETATARVESLMWPPWLGYLMQRARIGPSS